MNSKATKYPISQKFSGTEARELMAEIGEYADSLNSPYTEEDVPRLIKESRAAEVLSRGSYTPVKTNSSRAEV